MRAEDVTHISKWLDEKDIQYETNADLAKKTWIKNGGIAELYITPGNLNELESVLLELSNRKKEFIIVGHTSNMFFSNSYNPPIILSTGKINEFVVEGNKIICECGASLMKVAKNCVNKGISGYQGLTGIPGTVGAAVCNNSGAYKCEMSKLVKRVEVLLANGEKVWLTNDELEFSYRNSAVKSGKIKCCVLRIELSAQLKNKPETLMTMVEENAVKRRQYYENYNQNLGTVFSSMDIYSGRILLQILLKIHRYLTILLPLTVQNKTKKMLVLAYFNKLKLYPYISEKRMNCFIWNKKKAYEDKRFYEYIEFIKSKSCVEATLELQIIDESIESTRE